MLKGIKLGHVFALAAMLIAAPRYAGISAVAAGQPLTGWVWLAVEVAGGVGLAILEALSISYAASTYSAAKPGKTRNLLLVLIVMTLACLCVMIAPYMRATAGGESVRSVLNNAWFWIWSASIGVASILIMAMAGVSENLRAETDESCSPVSQAKTELLSIQSFIEKAKQSATKAAEELTEKQDELAKVREAITLAKERNRALLFPSDIVITNETGKTVQDSVAGTASDAPQPSKTRAIPSAAGLPAVNGHAASNQGPQNGDFRQGESVEDAVTRLLKADPSLTSERVASAVGVSGSAVRASNAWKKRSSVTSLPVHDSDSVMAVTMTVTDALPEAQ